MIDIRHQTFLTLCKIGSYTKVAQELNITQPAVTQHIKYLEQLYGHKLFLYEARQLKLTEHGKLLQQFALTMCADSKKLRKILLAENPAVCPISFGATLTIGQYIMPKILSKLIAQFNNISISFCVDNTEILLQKLRDGKIDFAFIEGYFDKAQYGCEIFSKEVFVPICSKNYVLKNKPLTLIDLLSQRLILREKGSGTRDVFEHLLQNHNLSLNSFDKICSVGNISAIKHLVANDLGISFLYKAAIQKELESKELFVLNIEGLPIKCEFNFVYLKNSINKNEYLKWFEFFKQHK